MTTLLKGSDFKFYIGGMEYTNALWCTEIQYNGLSDHAKKDYFAILQQPVRADVRRVYFLQQTPYPDLLPITLSFCSR